MSKQTLIKSISENYPATNAVNLGGILFENKILEGSFVEIPLRNLNRHGLVSGATGTGKTKSIQKLTELLIQNGVSVFGLDMKGDLSGLAIAGTEDDKIKARQAEINIPWTAKATPVEFMSLNGEPGIQFRVTVSEFGPVLLSKLLGLNDTQESVISLIFKYCDDSAIPLIDLDDLKFTLNYLIGDGKAEIKSEYGVISSSTVSTILRKIIELEQQSGGGLFGEPSFEVTDLIAGKATILRVDKIQDQPQLFSTCMLSILSEVYSKFPEVGDQDKPKLVIFIDEAHLIFENATTALIQRIESIIKLIRSKGVGIFFITQHPTDIPESILAQLGTKIQHALRAFTPNDRKDIKLMVENFPISEDYDLEKIITELGIGEAIVTTLTDAGNPTPIVHCKVTSPESRMGPLLDSELATIASQSALASRYATKLEKDGAREVLTKKFQALQTTQPTVPPVVTNQPQGNSTMDTVEDFAGKFSKNMMSSMGRSVGTSLTRSILGGIFGKK